MPQSNKQLLAIRGERRCGHEEISEHTGVPARTVSRILTQDRVPPLAALDPIPGQMIGPNKVTAVRNERTRPGELVHMDVKKLGKIPPGGGWRAHGRGADPIRRDRSTKVGFDYVHSLVDDRTRPAYCEALPTSGARPARASSPGPRRTSQFTTSIGSRN